MRHSVCGRKNKVKRNRRTFAEVRVRGDGIIHAAHVANRTSALAAPFFNMAVKYILSFIFILVYIFFGHEIGFVTNSPWWTHFTYTFQHASILHLVINTLVFINVFRVMEKFLSWKVLLPAIYFIATCASFASVQSIPTVGASGMIYAMFGMMSFIVLFNSSSWRQKRVFFLSIAFMLLVSFFNKGSNFEVHVLSFLIGVLYYPILRHA